MARTAAVDVRPLTLADLERTRPLWDAVASEAAALHPTPDADALIERARVRLVESDRVVRQGQPPTFRICVAWTPQGEPVGLAQWVRDALRPRGELEARIVELGHQVVDVVRRLVDFLPQRGRGARAGGRCSAR